VINIYTLGQQEPHTTFEYDLNGNMTSRTVNGQLTKYTYDRENRLRIVRYPDPEGGLTDFRYDALGRRFKTITKNAQGDVVGDKRYVYDGLDLIADLNKFDQVVASYTNGLGIDDPLIMRWNGDDYFYHKDHLGSVTMITDDEGEDDPPAKKYQYDAYGNIRGMTGSLTYNTLTYTARERHVASGLYYYRARFYDPQLGRFITPDPIGHLGGMNLYAYVGNTQSGLDTTPR